MRDGEHLSVVSNGCRQQGEGVLHGDSLLDELLTQTLQAILTVGRGQIQQACSRHTKTSTSKHTNQEPCEQKHKLTDGVLGRQVDRVGVEEMQEGSVDRVGELANLDHVLLVLSPLRAKHGTEVLAPINLHSM